MERESQHCRRILRQKTSFFGCLVEYFSPVEPCNKLISSLVRLDYACKACSSRPAIEWPLWDKQWAFPTMDFDDDEIDEEKHWSGRQFTQHQWEGLTPEDTTEHEIAGVYAVTGPPEEAVLRRVPSRRWSCETLDGRDDAVLVSGDHPQHSQQVPYQHKTLESFRQIYRVSACENLRFAFRDSLSGSSEEHIEAMEKAIDTRGPFVEGPTQYYESEPYVLQRYSGVFDDASHASHRLWDEYEARNAMSCYGQDDKRAFE
jgi:hypothetical protein